MTVNENAAVTHDAESAAIVADDLWFPEGPTILPDGRVAWVEMGAGTVSAMSPDGSPEVVAHTGGGPNGLAVGPDEMLYVCNNGGVGWVDHEGRRRPQGGVGDREPARIDAVDPRTAEVTRLYEHCDDVALGAPNDVVFPPHGSSSEGGFWFTDLGGHRGRGRDHGSVYWAAVDGNRIIEAIHPVVGGANGIGLSPDGEVLYVAETETGRLWSWQVEGPGRLKKEPWPNVNGGHLVRQLPHGRRLDSMAVTSAGNIVVGTLVAGELTTISPDGEVLDVCRFDDPWTTNVCFGGADMTTAYVTLSMDGQLVSLPWREPGLRLPF
jgi:gluconolactonase